MEVLLSAAKLRAEGMAEDARRSSVQKIPFPINHRGRFFQDGREVYNSQNNLLLNAIERKKDPEADQVVKRIRFYTQVEDDGEVKERPGARNMGRALVRTIIERVHREGATQSHIPAFLFLRGVGGSWVTWIHRIGLAEVHEGADMHAASFRRQQTSASLCHPRGVIQGIQASEVRQALEARGSLQACHVLHALGALQTKGPPKPQHRRE